MDKDSIQKYIIEELSKALQLPAESLDPNTEFLNLRVDSLVGVDLMINLERYLGKELNPMIFWDYPTISKLSEYLADKFN